MNVCSFSEAGGHVHNEDAFDVRPHPHDPAALMCFVADGQGGRAGGGPAARLACRTAVEVVSAVPPDRLSDPGVWTGLVRRVDEAVRLDPEAGFTTFVGLVITTGRIVGASCGDSAALVVAEAGAIELTRGQHKNPPIGCGAAVPATFRATVAAPWQLIVMTDGVWKYVGWQRLVDVARRERGAGMIDELQRVARLPGSGRFQDDFTVVLLESAPGAGTRVGKTSETL